MKAKRTLLLIDDQAESRAKIASALKRKGYYVLQVEGGQEALVHLKRQPVMGALLDLSLGQGEGWTVLRALQVQHPQCPVVVFGTTTGGVEEAVQVMKAGATDYLRQPLHLPALYAALEQACQRENEKKPWPQPVSPADGSFALDRFVAISSLMREVLDTLYRVAPTDVSVLITGESGVGKEVIAQALHYLSPRRSRDFVPVNCATLSDEILENELFGHEKGAFTSADQSKLGVFELAHGGTLFLDEVNEMGITCQAKLLRALERREFRRLGGTGKIRVDMRILSAANLDLEEAVRGRRFREDLLYRLNVVHIPIAPLRERREAIIPMAEMFLGEFAEKHGKRGKVFARETLRWLQQYAWPGNVRELRNVIESLVLMSKGETIKDRDLPINIRAVSSPCEIRLPMGLTLKEAEKEILRRYLEVFPTKKESARALGMGLRTLHAKAKAYALPSLRSKRSGLRSAKKAALP